MKKSFLLASIIFLSTSCKKDNSAVKDATNSEQKSQNKNEMVALMDRMMEDMHDEKTVGNNDADFSNMMIAHHQGAVEMSELLLKKGSDLDMKNFAHQVIDAQSREIKLMQNFIGRTTPSANSKEFLAASHQSMAVMMDKTIPVHNHVDKDFAQQMIPHHKSAVEMAEAYLKYGTDKELLKLSQDIVHDQTSEILMLQQWLKKDKINKVARP